MDQALLRAIESRRPYWVLTLAVPFPARAAEVMAALRRLAGRIMADAACCEIGPGLALWGAGEEPPASAPRLAARLAQLLPEAAGPGPGTGPGTGADALATLLRPWTLPAMADELRGYCGNPRAHDPGRDDIMPGAESARMLLALQRAIAGLGGDGWVRRLPVVAVKPPEPARLAAWRLAPDPATIARLLAATQSGSVQPTQVRREMAPRVAVTEEMRRLLDLLLMSTLVARMRAQPHGAEQRMLLLPVAPAAGLGGAYDALEAAVPQGAMARLVPCVALADAVADPGLFAMARTRFAADGQRLLLHGAGLATLPLLAAMAGPGDLVGVSAAGRGGHADAASRAAITALGPQRMVLHDCHDERDLAFGVSLGITLFDGPVVEALLAQRASARNTDTQRASARNTDAERASARTGEAPRRTGSF